MWKIAVPYLLICFCVFPVLLSAQPVFDFVLWHEQGGLLSAATSVEESKTRLESHWYEQNLPSMLSESLRIHVPKSDSIQHYQQQIQKLQPACIEGDPVFVERVINPQEKMRYIPVLESKHRIHAEIVFRSTSPNWEGKLGVVHPQYSAGGWLQTEYWKTISGSPDVHVFGSVQEVLMHLMAGSVDAAAVPEGALASFLEKQNHEELLDRFYRITVPNPNPATMVFLLQHEYENVLHRTLISETWLRDLLFDSLDVVKQQSGFISESGSPSF